MEEIKAPYIKIKGKYIKPFCSWRKVHPDGYVGIRDNKGKWVLEHRLAMEEILGRKLEAWEIVHHFDGDKSNNNKNNLVLCKSNTSHAIMHKFQHSEGISLKRYLAVQFYMLYTDLKTGLIFSRLLQEGYHQEIRRSNKIVYVKS